MSSSNKDVVVFSVAAFLAGMSVSSLIRSHIDSKKEKSSRQNAGATPENNDLSLFFADEKSLTTIPDSKKFLPAEFYRQMVQDCVVTCVDALLVRKNPTTKKLETLLVYRADEPVKGVWWWPGGRMFKGETFFTCAMRKVRQETGISSEEARPVQVLGVWNTFFPTSAWDDEKEKGTQTVNPIVLVVLPEGGACQDVKLDKTSEKHKWVEVDSKLAEERGDVSYVLEGLRRLEAWRDTYGQL